VLEGDELALTGTDLELAISVSVTVAGMGDGVAVVPARLFAEIVRALEPGAVEIEVGDDTAQVTSGRSQFSLPSPGATPSRSTPRPWPAPCARWCRRPAPTTRGRS
jgi:DNA polymerase III sliding clamp (beta) subunit (PCNA family)